MLKRIFDPSIFLLCGLLFLGLILRVWGITYGLPHIYFTDEAITVNQVLVMGYDHTLKPQNYAYPSALMYFLGALYTGYYIAASLLAGCVWSFHDFAIAILRNPSTLYLISRAFSVAVSLGTIPVVYCLGRKMFGRVAALVAASAVTFTYMLCFLAHFVKVESLETFFAITAFSMGFKAANSERRLHYGVAGFFAGLTAAAKYNGGLVILPILLQALRTSRWSWRGRCLNLLLITGAAMAGFFVLMPYAFLDFGGFLKGLSARGHFSFDRVGAPAVFTQWWSGSLEWLGLGLAVFYLAGILSVLRPNWNKVCLAIFPLIHFAFFSIASSWKNIHWQAPVVPFLALLAGALFSSLWYSWNRPTVRAILVVGFSFAVLQSGYLTCRRDFLLNHQDTRTLALHWIQLHIPKHSIIVMDHGQFLPAMAPPVRQTPSSIEKNYYGQTNTVGYTYPDKRKYFDLLKEANEEPLYEVYPILHDDFGGQAEFLRRPGPESIDWYRTKGASYAVLAGYEDVYEEPGVRDRFGSYVEPYLRFYQSVVKEGHLLAQFVPLHRLGPRIRIYCIAKPCPHMVHS